MLKKIKKLIYYFFFSAHTLLRFKLHEYFSPRQIKKYQEKKLREIVLYSSKYIPYYRELFKNSEINPLNIKTLDDLKKIPILTKTIVRENIPMFISEQEIKNESVFYSMTTGSTGIPLKIANTMKEYIYSRWYVLYGYFKMGLRIFDKFVVIHAPSEKITKRMFYEKIIFSEYHMDLRDGIENNVKELNQIKPDIISSFPSYLSLLSKYILENNISVYSPRCIFTQGELLDAQTREIIEKAFGCKIRNTYASIESSFLAFECKQGKLHIMPDIAIVETDGFMNKDDRSEEIIITSLYRKTMPFIRYKLGDRVVISGEKCECGNKSKTIESIIGRSDDYIILPSGEKISARAVNLFESVPGIMEYQIVQKKRDHIIVFVKAGKLFSKASEEKIKKVIAKGCLNENILIEVLIKDNLIRSLRGKLKTLISEVVNI